jgi:putative ABC transport system permease protein
MRQSLALIAISLSSLPQRMGPILTIIVGVTCAVGALVSMLAMGAGARQQEMADVRDDRVIITGLDAQGAMSAIPLNEAAVVGDLPQIRRDAAGRPIVVMESISPLYGRERSTGALITMPLFGVTPNVTEYRPEMRLTVGRMFRPGLHELVASNTCARQFSDFDIGARPSIEGDRWTVVGHFDLGRSNQCVIYADVRTIMADFSRSAYSSIEVMLRSPAEFTAFRAAIKANPALRLNAELQRTVVMRNYRQLNAILDYASYFVGAIMAIGGMLGAMNSLYAIVDSRERELATLRALGFGPVPVMIATLFDSMLLALPGALVGAALAWAFFNGLSASPFGYAFQLAVTPALALLGVVWALAMGFIGGLPPALRAVRVSMVSALGAMEA